MALINDHEDAAVNRLLEQYKNRPLIEGLIRCLVAPIQVLEDEICRLDTRLQIDVIDGINLDRLGTIVGALRNGLSDEDFRIIIKVRIIQNLSEGEPERLIQVFGLLLDSNLIHLQELFPAGVFLSAAGTIAPDKVDFFLENLELVAAAGVRVDFIGCFDPIEPFAFAGALPGLGFSDTGAPLSGGVFAFLHQPLGPPFAFAGADPFGGGFGTLEDTLVGGLFQSL